MLDRSTESRREMLALPDASETAMPSIDIVQLVSIVRRQRWVIAAVFLAVLVLGAVYCVVARPKYTAENDIIIDSHKNVADLTASLADATLDSAAIDSQVEIIKSDNVATLVVKALQLDQNDQFMGNDNPLAAVGNVLKIFDFKSWFTSTTVSEEDARQAARQAAVGKLEAILEVKRVARTYVLAVSITSPYPKLAADIANAYADAYFTDQLNARYEQTKRASGWLQDRLAELKVNSIKADQAIQKFKAEHGLVSSGDGKYVGDQQVQELTTQLSTAHDATAQAESKLQQITDIIQSGKLDVAVTDQLGSPVINDLRSKYLTAAKTLQDLTARLGPTHYQVIRLQQDMNEYQRLIFTELKRIAQTYASDLEVARGREKSLNDSMGALAGQQAVSNEVMVQLRQLTRESDTYQGLYTTFLQRYQDALQQQSFPSTEARTITAAIVPGRPSWPKVPLVLALSGVLGLLLGGGVAALREYNDRVFRTPDQVKDETGLHFIGLLQKVSSLKLAVKPEMQHPGELLIRDSVMRYVLDFPLTGYAETLRSAKVEADLQILGHRKVIGVVSSLPGEGKTTTSKNLASLIASQGARVLLIDADFRNPGLSRRIAPHATGGLLEVLKLERGLDELLLVEPDSGLRFLPNVVKKRVLDSHVLLSSKEMEQLLEYATSVYDYVIVDLPPLGPVIDVRAASRFFDGFVFVVEWGVTPRAMLRRILEENRDIYDKALGVIFNHVIDVKMKQYGYGEARGYYYGKYRNYYIDVKEVNDNGKKRKRLS
jgi:succinoglycan biosynthesis transport protein ExoP